MVITQHWGSWCNLQDPTSRLGLGGVGSVRLDFGLTSPHHVSNVAAASSYGNLSVFNPREDHLDAADPDEAAPSLSPATTHFKNRLALPWLLSSVLLSILAELV